MFDQRSSLRRRVSVSHEHGQLVIRIQRRNERTTAILNLILALFLLGFTGWTFLPSLFRMRSFIDLLYWLPFPALFAAVCIGMLRLSLIAAFGVEEVVVGHERLVWAQRAIFLSRKIEVASKDITTITAKPFFGGWGRVDIIARKRTLSIGNQILEEEAKEIAAKLRHASIG